MRKRVVITGLGTINPLGKNVESTWKNILAGKSGVGLISHFDPTEFNSRIAAEVKDFDPKALFGRKEARRMDRVSQFSLVAADQAVKDAELVIDDSNRDRIGVVIGTGIGGIGTLYDQMQVFKKRGPTRLSPFFIPMILPDTSGAMVAIHLGVRGPNLAVVTACATGTNAIGESVAIIRLGQADVILAGGTEAAILPLAMAGMGVMKALSNRNDDPEGASRPFDRDRDGFVMGEGSAVLVLESLEHALDRGANILAEVSGYGTSNDAFHVSAPAENGDGAALCMRFALEDAQFGVKDIEYINAHGTSTKLNDKSETAAIKTVFGEQAYQIPVSSTKSMTGHLLGAAGAIEALFCVKAIGDDVLPPTINYQTFDPECDLDYVPNTPRSSRVANVMSNSFGFGGHNATIILSRYADNS
jgi:3-oxoacyl-[acyl-carrier-protein] synthase II